MRIQWDERWPFRDESMEMCFSFVLSHLNIGTF